MKSSKLIIIMGTLIVLAGCSDGETIVTVTQTITATPTTSISSLTSTSTQPTTQATPTATHAQDHQEPQQQTLVYNDPELTIPRPGPLGELDLYPEAEGFTGAPNGVPQQLDKTIAYCMNDPAIYQPGTTMFTDGTTGWTTYCAGM